MPKKINAFKFLHLYFYKDESMCLVTAGLLRCVYSVGGMNRLILTNWEDINDYYFNTGDTKYTTVSSLNMDSGTEWYEYTVTKALNNFSEVEQVSENGKLFIQTLDVTFIKLEPEKRDRLVELLNSKLTSVFKDNNSQWIILGEELPLKAINYKAETGTDEGTSNYRVTFECRSKVPARFIDTDYVLDNITLEGSGGGTPPAELCDCPTFESSILDDTWTCQLDDIGLSCVLVP